MFITHKVIPSFFYFLQNRSCPSALATSPPPQRLVPNPCSRSSSKRCP